MLHSLPRSFVSCIPHNWNHISTLCVLKRVEHVKRVRVRGRLLHHSVSQCLNTSGCVRSVVSSEPLPLWGCNSFLFFTHSLTLLWFHKSCERNGKAPDQVEIPAAFHTGPQRALLKCTLPNGVPDELWMFILCGNNNKEKWLKQYLYLMICSMEIPDGTLWLKAGNSST